MSEARVPWFHERPSWSADAVLRTAEVFVAIGDHETVRRCVQLASRLAADSADAEVLERVRSFSAGVVLDLPHLP